MNKIKLLFVTGVSSGGVLKHIYDLSANLCQSQFDIHLILPSKNHLYETKKVIEKLSAQNINVNFIYIHSGLSLLDIYSVIQGVLFLKKHKFDIVHVHSSKAGGLFRIAAFIVHVPVIYTPHCFYFNSKKGLKRIFFRNLEGILSKITNRIIISGTEGKAIDEIKIDKKRVVVIDNSINPTEYKKNDIVTDSKHHLNIPANHKIIIGIGRLVEQKNWIGFIEIAKLILLKNENVTFIIAGEGPEREKLQKHITQVGLKNNIRLPGYIHNISKLYKMADLMISTSSWEGLPYIYLEALYFKIPLIVTYYQGIEYWLKKGNCIVLSPNNLRLLAEKAEQIMNHPSCIKSNCADCSFDNYINDYTNLYFNLYTQHAYSIPKFIL